MIKLEKSEVMGWEHVIRGMRNPMNSWHLSDSKYCTERESECANCGYGKENSLPCPLGNPVVIGSKDYDLMKRLVKAGSDHSKFMRMITVYVDITAPLYWWKEFDTYKIGTVANSCSTMHKIHEREFTLKDFSREHLITSYGCEWGDVVPFELLQSTVMVLNQYRLKFIETKDKEYWWQMIQLLPSSYNQKRTIMLNYAVLRAMYHARVTHKLDEWCDFCEWIESLPYSELITMENEHE